MLYDSLSSTAPLSRDYTILRSPLEYGRMLLKVFLNHGGVKVSYQFLFLSCRALDLI